MVAEQQLPVPLHWFQGGPMQPSPDDTAAHKAAGSLKVEETTRDGSNCVVITGQDGFMLVVSHSRRTEGTD